VPPGQRVTFNIDGRHVDMADFREDVMLNHDEHGNILQQRDRPTTEMNEAYKTTDKDRVEFR
jgi:hypothetical protein